MKQLIDFVRSETGIAGVVPLHEPTFSTIEKGFLCDAIDSTYVSSVGPYVDRFEQELKEISGAAHVTSVVNGTCGLHVCLWAAGVRAGDLVLTQAVTFVATCNSIAQIGARPVFIDIDDVSYGMCPDALDHWLQENAQVNDEGVCLYKIDQRRIRAIVPVHTFGHPVDLDRLVDISRKWCLPLIEDSAEAFGSLYKGKHAGTYGDYGVVSFNGNKVITTGGGGAVFSRSSSAGDALKHLATTGKKPHPFEFNHDCVAFNYRMPNINAALGCAQLVAFQEKIKVKRALANKYKNFFKNTSFKFINEPMYARSNYWLNAIVCETKGQRDELLRSTNEAGISTRPVWTLMKNLPMFKEDIAGPLPVSKRAAELIVNLPSTPYSTIKY